jgi:hypothetical protein
MISNKDTYSNAWQGYEVIRLPTYLAIAYARCPYRNGV